MKNRFRYMEFLLAKGRPNTASMIRHRMEGNVATFGLPKNTVTNIYPNSAGMIFPNPGESTGLDITG